VFYILNSDFSGLAKLKENWRFALHTLFC